MLNFRKPELRDRELIISRVNEGTTDGTCFSFGSIFAWCEAYSVEIAEYGGLLLIRGADRDGGYYFYPSGKGDIKAAVKAMMEEAREKGQIFRIYQLLEEHKKQLDEMFPGEFDFSYDRDDSEYVYSIKNMTELPGKKFHGKKGHINAFFRNHDNISCDPITDDNIKYCYEIENEWLAERDGNSAELEYEHNAIFKALDNYKELCFSGALLYADGKPVAFTMGEPIKNNTFCTHYEKTLPDYKDAYPVINNGFTKLMLSTYDYVNREEDTGAEGLRKAKLSYCPEFLLNKYSAVLKDDPMRKYKAFEEDVPSLKSLWKTVFGDENDVIDFFFDYTVDLKDIFCYKADGKVVSAFYLIDADIVTANESRRAKYLYAAATLPEYRGKGFMSEMIEYAKYFLPFGGYEYLFLYPAEDSLYNYYKKFGFVPAMKARYYDIGICQLDSFKGRRYFNSPVSYCDLTEFTPSEEYIAFPSSYLDFAELCAHKYGFEYGVVFDDEVKTLIIGNTDKRSNTLYIEEALLSGGNFGHALSVAADSGYDRIVIKTPPDVNIPSFKSEIKDAGMILSLSGGSIENNIYLGQPCM